MMEAYEVLKSFWEYLEFYPCEDEPDYDGVHDGGIRGISEGAPESAKKRLQSIRRDKGNMRSEV